MNSILYETDEQRKHVHTGWSKVVAVDEVYWKCNHCGVTADSPVAPADDPKVAEEGSSTNDRANAEVSRKLAQEAQSEAPSVEAILTEMVENTIMFLTNDLPSLLEQDRVAKIRRYHKDEILKNLPEAAAKINRLIVEAKRDGAREYFNMLDEQDPYVPLDGTPRQYAHSQLMRYEQELSNNLSKGDGDEANGA